MIVTRTPFRVTLGGGGTDLPSYYRRCGGFVFAMAIDKYMYVMTNPPIVDRKIRVHYTRSETVDHVSELKHELAREALRFHGVENSMEISSMADLPAGTGLGSSSAYLVGLLNALHHHRREYVTLHELAEEACRIELEVLSKRIGKQDQYMAAFGGLTMLEIERDGRVHVDSLPLSSGSIQAFVANTHLYYTGLRRSAEAVLRDQDDALRGMGGQGDGAADTPDTDPSPGDGRARLVEEALDRIRELGYGIRDAIRDDDFDAWGRLLHLHWCEKKRMSEKIAISWVDELYDYVLSAFGVLGGKLCGAGGGGFLMLYCPAKHKALESFMAARGLPRLHYTVEHEGSRVMANLATSRA